MIYFSTQFDEFLGYMILRGKLKQLAPNFPTSVLVQNTKKIIFFFKLVSVFLHTAIKRSE